MMDHPFVSLTRATEITEHDAKAYLAQRRKGAEDFSLFINPAAGGNNEKVALWKSGLLHVTSFFTINKIFSMSSLFADQVLVISEKQCQNSMRFVSRAKRVVKL